MSQVTVAIDSTCALDQIQAAIAAQEALSMRFQDGEPATDQGKAINRVTFKRLYQPPLPAPPRLVLKQAPSPPGLTRQWSGTLLVQGAPQQVALYR